MTDPGAYANAPSKRAFVDHSLSTNQCRYPSCATVPGPSHDAPRSLEIRVIEVPDELGIVQFEAVAASTVCRRWGRGLPGASPLPLPPPQINDLAMAVQDCFDVALVNFVLVVGTIAYDAGVADIAARRLLDVLPLGSTPIVAVSF